MARVIQRIGKARLYSGSGDMCGGTDENRKVFFPRASAAREGSQAREAIAKNPRRDNSLKCLKHFSEMFLRCAHFKQFPRNVKLEGLELVFRGYLQHYQHKAGILRLNAAAEACEP